MPVRCAIFSLMFTKGGRRACKIRTLLWLVKIVAFFGWYVQSLRLCKGGRWIFDAGRFLPNNGGQGSCLS